MMLYACAINFGATPVYIIESAMAADRINKKKTFKWTSEMVADLLTCLSKETISFSQLRCNKPIHCILLIDRL